VVRGGSWVDCPCRRFRPKALLSERMRRSGHAITTGPPVIRPARHVQGSPAGLRPWRAPGPPCRGRRATESAPRYRSMRTTRPQSDSAQMSRIPRDGGLRLRSKCHNPADINMNSNNTRLAHQALGSPAGNHAARQGILASQHRPSRCLRAEPPRWTGPMQDRYGPGEGPAEKGETRRDSGPVGV